MNITWNADDYEKGFGFVPDYGQDVFSLLTVPAGSFVLDLGCGTGRLTKRLAAEGYRAAGIDASPEMVKKAAESCPGIPFMVGDALTFSLEEKADAVFSNAVFHWIDEDKQEQMLRNIADNLKDGGELVFEFGGKGCGELVHAELERCFARRGMDYPRVFYFPSIGQYAPILERCGFKVEYAVLFDRPTPQAPESGLAGWIRMFVKKAFEHVPEDRKEEIMEEACCNLKPVLYQRGTWIVDYVRIRMRARKQGPV